MWKAALITVALALVLATGGLASPTGVAGTGGGVMPAGWTHAEINYYVGGAGHTLILDRGLVTSASGSALTLREQDGTSWTIPLSPSTQVIANGSPGTITMIRRGEIALTRRVDGGPASAVQLRIPPRIAARIAAGR